MSRSTPLRPIVRRLVREVFYLGIGFAGALVRLTGHRDPGGLLPRRILIIRLDLLGDVLHSLPAAQALREAYPAARITMLTLPYTAPLARMSPFLDEVVTVDTNLIRRPRTLVSPGTWAGYTRVLRQLRAAKIDLAVSLSGRMSSLCAFLSGASRIVGFTSEAYPFLLTEPIPGGRPVERIHESEYVQRLSLAAGARSVSSSVHLSPGGDVRRRVGELLASNGITARDRVVVIHAGAVNGSAKRWPPASWARFAREVRNRTGARIVLAGAAADRPIAAEVLRFDPESVSVVGQTSIEELLALLERAAVVASGDSGPLHLAAALGRPLVAVYGPTDPAVYGPGQTAGEVRLHRKDLPCSPCYTMASSAECPLGDPICMRLVTVGEMVASAVELMAD